MDKAHMMDIAGALDRVDGDKELLQELIELYMEDTPQQIAKLTEALASGDRATAEMQAHTLKSSSGNIGAEVLRELAAKMEMASKGENLDETRALFEQFLSAFEDLKQLTSDPAALFD